MVQIIFPNFKHFSHKYCDANIILIFNYNFFNIFGDIDCYINN
jgi:hypothetical protein